MPTTGRLGCVRGRHDQCRGTTRTASGGCLSARKWYIGYPCTNETEFPPQRKYYSIKPFSSFAFLKALTWRKLTINLRDAWGSADRKMVWQEFEFKPWEEIYIDIKTTSFGICSFNLCTLCGLGYVALVPSILVKKGGRR
ncbi:hypothetical protein EYZ11_010625 [Aspergillus tanneri]|uniref:Uncharacterized protein n=1 Tax=Aspergillus tanneri TaxID=1220188 RepID=A0A4S3J4V2_9EURO|nr:hypothetical protein EYZ11_010625 [Aspergillus tanneri]